MFKKIFKFSLITGCFLALAGVIGWLSVKHVSTWQAEKIARSVIHHAGQKHAPKNEDEKVIAIAEQIFERFQATDPATVPLLRIRPYITNKRLPEFLRLETGVLEAHLQKGLCDNASRMLAFLLKQKSLNSVQWNMVTNVSGHSALLVTLSDGRDVFIDPFYGYATTDKNGKLIHIEDAQSMIKKGKRFEDVFKPLGNNADPRFYSNIKTTMMAAEGSDLIIKAIIPKLAKSPLKLGTIDGKDNDVKSAGAQYNMTNYWSYVGHKYNREWVRILETQQPVQIKMTLLETPEKGVLTSTPPPNVEGKTLSWNLNAGDQIVFKDALAKISLKRLNSYIGVDQIEISLIK